MFYMVLLSTISFFLHNLTFIFRWWRDSTRHWAGAVQKQGESVWKLSSIHKLEVQLESMAIEKFRTRYRQNSIFNEMAHYIYNWRIFVAPYRGKKWRFKIPVGTLYHSGLCMQVAWPNWDICTFFRLLFNSYSR